MSKFNVIAKIRTQEVASYDGDGDPIYEPKDSDRIFLEGFGTVESAQRAADAAVRNNPAVVVSAWTQRSGEPPDESKALKPDTVDVQAEAWRRYRQTAIEREAYESSDADPGL